MDCTGTGRQWLAATTASVALFVTGMFLGWPSPVIEKLKSSVNEVQMDDNQISWMISVIYIGSIVSPIPAGKLMDKYGRKRTILFALTLAITGWLLLIFSCNVWSIYLSRFLGGMSGGVFYTITPIYLSEIAQPEVRGALNTLFTLMVYLGIMFEYSIGPYNSYTNLNLISTTIPVIFMVSLYYIPESPYYYLLHGDRNRAQKALVWLRCEYSSNSIQEELTLIHKSVLEDTKNKGSLKSLLVNKNLRKALLITEILAMLQRLSGSSVIMAYISTALPDTDILTKHGCAIVICSIWIVLGVWSTTLIDQVGRRPLLTVSCIGCSLSTACTALCFYCARDNKRINSWYPFLSLVGYSTFFPVGLACVPSVIQGEIFPANVKGIASGITSITVAVTSFITNKLYQNISELYGVYVNYIIFSLCSTFGIYFALFMMIETRGKSLHQIQTEFVQCVSTSNKQGQLSNKEPNTENKRDEKK